MKSYLKCFLFFLCLLGAFRATAQAQQEVYLSESPNGKFRVVVDQVIDRRIDDRIFFRYPLSVVNTRDPSHHFEMRDAGSALVQETDRGTFKIADWDAVHFDWSPDSLCFFMQLQILNGVWRTYFVDVEKGTTKDITGDIEQAIVKKSDFHKWDVQVPQVELVQWVPPYYAFLKLQTLYGTDRTKESKWLKSLADSVFFDLRKQKTVDHCINCGDASALKKFDRYYQSTIPTPTPTPEETPTS